MSVTTYMYRWLVSLLLTVYYSILVLVLFVTTYLKNPFSNPWQLKLKLEPPTCLADPKYGVHKYTKVNNIKLHYVESGDPSKPLMIFIHGFPELWYSWRHQIVEFKKDYWCIAFDMRGYGDSERPDGVSSYKLKLLIDDVRDLVKHLGREKCIIVAHDWGSLVACHFRDVYPDMVSGLVILAGCSREAFNEEIWNNPAQRKKSWYVFMFQAPALAEKMMQMNNMQMFEKTLLQAGNDSVTQQDVEAYKYWFGKQHTMTPPVNYYRANFEYTLPEKPRSTAKIPFLAIHPEKDLYLSASLHDRMKNEYECIETTILKDCGHFCQQQEPAKFNQLLRHFLAKNNL